MQERVEYDDLCMRFAHEDIDELIELIADVLTSTKTTTRIGGEEIPTEQVKKRFRQLDRECMEYVFDSLRRNTTDIRNIRAYLLTTLYNAPVTHKNFYQALVRHDLGP